MEVVIGAADDELPAAFYADVYLPAFAHQREPLEAWRQALRGAGYALTIVIAGEDLHDRSRRRIDGGVVFERYPRSGGAIITYLVVAPHARGGGLGARLLHRAREALRDATIVVAEVHTPDTDEDRARIAWFARRGAGVIDVRYVQPDLGYGRDPRLQLIAFTDGEDSIDGAALRAFLREFYETIEGAIDADTEAMLASIGPRARVTVASRR